MWQCSQGQCLENPTASHLCSCNPAEAKCSSSWRECRGKALFQQEMGYLRRENDLPGETSLYEFPLSGLSTCIVPVYNTGIKIIRSPSKCKLQFCLSIQLPTLVYLRSCCQDNKTWKERVAVNNQLVNNELGLYMVYCGKFKLKERWISNYRNSSLESSDMIHFWCFAWALLLKLLKELGKDLKR